MFECHITIDPVSMEQLPQIEGIAKGHRFKVAKLLMQNRATSTLQRSENDTFLTGHSNDWADMLARMLLLIRELKDAGRSIWRYKIEKIILDSREQDNFDIITKSTPLQEPK